MPEPIGTLKDPEVRRERARRGGHARTTLDYHVRQVVEKAPALTPEQVERLRALLPPVGGDAA